MLSGADTEKTSNVAHGAVESLAPAVSGLSLKDSAKFDGAGGGRLVNDSDAVTPQLSVDRAMSSNITTAPSFPGQYSFADTSEDKSENVFVKMEDEKAFDVVSLLQSGQTLRCVRNNTNNNNNNNNKQTF